MSGAADAGGMKAGVEQTSGTSDPKVDAFIRQLLDQNVQSDIAPKKNGIWENPETPGNGLFTLDDDAVITLRKGITMTGRKIKEKHGISGVVYHLKEPDFSIFEDKELGHIELDEEMSVTRQGKEGTYAQALKKFSEITGKSKEEICKIMDERGLTFHECADRKTIRVVPTEINAAFPHTGGISKQQSIEAIRGVLYEEYGTTSFVLERNGIKGSINKDEFDSAVDSMRGAYRRKKKENKGKG